MGTQNSVPSQTWERIDSKVLGKSWEQEFPLMPVTTNKYKNIEKLLYTNQNLRGTLLSWLFLWFCLIQYNNFAQHFKLTCRFESDATIEYGGFKAVYSFIPSPLETLPFIPKCEFEVGGATGFIGDSWNYSALYWNLLWINRWLSLFKCLRTSRSGIVMLKLKGHKWLTDLPMFGSFFCVLLALFRHTC